MKAKIGPDLANIAIEHEDQTESDLQFLARLAVENGAVFTVKNKQLVFVAAATTTGVSGLPAPRLKLDPSMVKSDDGWETVQATRGNYTGVKAAWQDRPKSLKRWVQVGDGARVTSLPYSYPSEAAAQRAAESRLRALIRGTRTLRTTITGNPSFAAEHHVDASGFEDGTDGEWILTRVEHTIDKTGFFTRIECEAVAES
jgi:phage protein D